MNDLAAIAVFLGCLAATLVLVPALEWLRPRGQGQTPAGDRTGSMPAVEEKRP